MEAAQVEGECLKHLFQRRDQKTFADFLNGAHHFKLGYLVDGIDVIHPLVLVLIALVNRIDADVAGLADTRNTFRPRTFHYERWGCGMTFTFPMAKLIDWERCWSELEASDNVFALVVMAQIHAKRLKDDATRKEVKVALVRLLYERGYSREQVVRLFNIIDRMLQLPRALEPEFVQAVYAIQEEKHMPYVNTIERLGIEKGEKLGIEKGRQEAEQRALAEKRETVRNLLSFGVLSDEQIAEATGLAVDEIAQLRVEDKH